MHHFDYRDGVLHAEGVILSALAEAVGTPFYCYSTATLERHYRVFADAFAGVTILVCYAMKANSNQSVLRTLAKLGAGADVVSGGELKRALAAGIPAEQDFVLGRRQDRSRTARGAGRGRSLHQCGIRARTRFAVEACDRDGAHGARSRSASIPMSIPARTPRFRPASPRTSSAFRSATRARSMPAPRSCRASRSPASTCISAARSPISARWRPRSAAGRFRHHAARRRPHHLACRFRRRPRHSLSRRP